jgi:hypothetical protein
MRQIARATLHAVVMMLAMTSAGQAQRGGSLDLTIGASHGSGGDYGNRTGAAADALLAFRMAPLGRAAVLGGVNAGLTGPIAGADVCLHRPDGSCLPDQPLFYSLAALTGVEVGAGALRIMGGPGRFTDAEDGDSGWGALVRIDGAVPVSGRIALVASARSALVPHFRNEMHTILAFSAGLRIR